MLANSKDIIKYLEDFHAGRISQGMGLGCKIDDYLRWKPSSLNLILGRNGVGKTYFKTWQYLVLSQRNPKMKWCVWTGENKAGQIVRNLIQIYSKKKFKDLSISEVYRYQQEIAQWFDFVDNKKLYKSNELLKIFEDGGYSGGLIDPYTGLDRGYGFGDNYDFLNHSREWVNKTGITLDICTHPVSASGRANALFPKDHMWAGYIRNPYQSDVEGGDSFSNRCDDFICLHRLKDNESMRFYTLLYVYKIKDHETGGMETIMDSPILLDFNYGMGFKVDGIDPMIDKPVMGNPDYVQKPLRPLTKEDLKPTATNYPDKEEDFFNNEPIDNLPF